MSKPVRRRAAVNPEFQRPQSAEEDLAIFQQVVREVLNDPQLLRQVLVKAGISTPSGKLTKPYRS